MGGGGEGYHACGRNLSGHRPSHPCTTGTGGGWGRRDDESLMVLLETNYSFRFPPHLPSCPTFTIIAPCRNLDLKKNIFSILIPTIYVFLTGLQGKFQIWERTPYARYNLAGNLPSSRLPAASAAVHVFIFIARRIQHFLLRRLASTCAAVHAYSHRCSQ